MSFESFAREHGLLLEHVIADGRVHRCRTEDHPRKKNGAYAFDGQSGFIQNWAVHAKAIAYRPDGKGAEIDREELLRLMRERREKEARDHAAASLRAVAMVKGAAWGPHPYLARKGFPRECGPVLDGRLLVPMWAAQDYGKKLNSVQTIAADGEKKFLPGGKAKGSIFRIGSGPELWHCEGYATGLSILEALKSLHRRATVVVCFSAANLQLVASSLGGRVAADNDKPDKEGRCAGSLAAIASGLPWVMPPDLGDDFNDYHQRAGLRAVADLLRGALMT